MWERRLITKIDGLRRNIRLRTQDANGNTNTKVLRKTEIIVDQNRSDSEKTAAEILETFEQKLEVCSQRLNRYKKSNKRREPNKLFSWNQK